MSLEKEAHDFISRRHDHFREGVQKRSEALEKFISDNLYHSTETHEALKNLIAVQMWAERASKMYGIKK